MTCESCGMSIEAGPYCQHCVDAKGDLKQFEETYTRFVQWATKDGTEPTEAEAKTRVYMRSMPAWKNHPSLRE